ncbi:DUF6582 domain-containing protein [Paraburkholderia caballeronis]|uniref:DUF6582 domain-containing protein n=1 Tax=Paraburkholderia caballeronis TaxID=416943 RepID=UPI0010D65846|nr:DUF6582 domain-containing protein [Paraburkholderia caballeronis]TDV04679.1 hypothetical protein C7408_13141 [Paraburkholderia caballeronis]TDV07922.1 hypothetical protein C7406_13341 [Paraburkholderia caballeronis]TDV18213.1 hypothetical protein C7404_13141 [Paraburkholderia caballeronis]
MSLNLFARLTKVDEENRLVYGRATDETVDRAGEIFDYDSSKPFFEKWSNDIAKATDGKSLGNLRAMHGNVAAGKLTSIEFNDGEKAIDIVTKIVDDNEWGKVLEGVYTGFSIGGSYYKTWMDTDAKARRFTADPCEISIVDLPCNPSAGFFDIQKADGSVMQKAFKAPAMTADSFSDEVAELAKSGELSMAEMLAAIRKAKDEKKKPYGDVEYADPQNEKYPIDTEEHIRAAWSYINQKKNADEYSAAELEEVKGRIIAAWKKEIDEDGPPSAADKAARVAMSKAGKPVNLAPANLLKAGHLAMAKGMPTCANLAYLLQSILCLSESVQAEEAREGDTASTLPDSVKEWLKQGGDLLVAMVTEEVAELTGPDGDIDGPDVCYVMWAAAAEGLEKAAAEAAGDRREFLQKVGARNSAADKDRIQKAHDLMADLGAQCAHGEDDDANKASAATLQKATTDLEAANAALVKVADERDALAKSNEDLTTERDDLKKRHDELTTERDTLQKTVAERDEKITKLSAQPAPSKGVLKAVDKSHDLIAAALQEEDVQPVLKQDGSIDAVATAIKKARRAGGVVVRPL